MSRLWTILIAAVLAAMLSLTACGGGSEGEEGTPQSSPQTLPASAPASPGDDWGGLLDQTLAIEDENASLQVEMGQLVQEFQQEIANASGPETLASSFEMMDDATDVIAKLRENFTSLSALWDEMAALDVSDAHGTYADQQKAIAQLQIELLDLTRDFFAEEKDLLTQIMEADTEAEAEKAGNKLSDMFTEYAAEVSQLSARIADEQQASERYYKENSL